MKIERKNDLSLRLLEVFGAVMRTQTTVVAAEELGLSQPAVSNAIRSLEKRLGMTLFERSNRGLLPTAEARLLFEEVEPVYMMMRGIERRIRDIKSTHDGYLRIVATPPLGHTVIPLALKRFLKGRSGVRVTYDVRRLDTTLAAIETNQFDVGFMFGLEQHPACDVMPLYEGAMACVLKADHALAAQDSISPDDIRCHNLIGIGLDIDSPLGAMIRAAFVSSRVPHETNIEVRYCHTAAVLADAGLGVAVVDPLTAHYSRSVELVSRPFVPETRVVASAIVRQGRTLPKVTEAFIEEIRRALNEIPIP